MNHTKSDRTCISNHESMHDEPGIQRNYLSQKMVTFVYRFVQNMELKIQSYSENAKELLHDLNF